MSWADSDAVRRRRPCDILRRGSALHPLDAPTCIEHGVCPGRAAPGALSGRVVGAAGCCVMTECQDMGGCDFVNDARPEPMFVSEDCDVTHH